jgi:hypothetical protein
MYIIPWKKPKIIKNIKNLRLYMCPVPLEDLSDAMIRIRGNE